MKLALAILIALQIGDVATTAYAIDTGQGHEGNPVAVAMLSFGGYGALIAAKAVAIAYVLALYEWLPGPGRAMLGFIVRALAIAYLYVVYSNLTVGGLI
jgi:hypothetical protein